MASRLQVLEHEVVSEDVDLLGLPLEHLLVGSYGKGLEHLNLLVSEHAVLLEDVDLSEVLLHLQ